MIKSISVMALDGAETAAPHPKVEFISLLMKQVKGDRSNELSDLFNGGDRDAFLERMAKLAKNIARKMPNAGDK